MYKIFYLSRKRRIFDPPPTLLGVNQQDDTFKDLSTEELDDTINEVRKRFLFC